MYGRCGTPRIRHAKRKAASATRLKNMTVVQLRDLCKKKGIRGYSKMTKDKLIKAHMQYLYMTRDKSIKTYYNVHKVAR